jgi:hypothetical protein
MLLRWREASPSLFGGNSGPPMLRVGASNKTDGTKPSESLESTTGLVRVAQGSLFKPCGFSMFGPLRVAPATGFSRGGPLMWTQYAHNELKDEFVEATGSLRLPHSNGLFNGTKPICIENKGRLEKQTQTKPKNEPNGYLQLADSKALS